MKTIDEIKADVLAKWPDAHLVIGVDDNFRVVSQAGESHGTNDEKTAWRSAHKILFPVSPGMRPETLALIHAEIDRIEKFLADPVRGNLGLGYSIATKYELDFLGKVLASEGKA